MRAAGPQGLDSASPRQKYATMHVLTSRTRALHAGMGSAQSIRGTVALSRSAKEPYVNRHALLNWLALFSLVGAAATIYLVGSTPCTRLCQTAAT